MSNRFTDFFLGTAIKPVQTQTTTTQPNPELEPIDEEEYYTEEESETEEPPAEASEMVSASDIYNELVKNLFK